MRVARQDSFRMVIALIDSIGQRVVAVYALRKSSPSVIGWDSTYIRAPIHDKRGIRSVAHLGAHSITPLDTFFSHIALPIQCYLTDCPPPFSRVARTTYVATRPQPCKDPPHRSSSLANAYKYTSTAHQRAGKLSGVKAKGYSNIGTICMATAHPLDDFFDKSNAWCLQALLNRMNRLLCLQCPHPACFR